MVFEVHVDKTPLRVSDSGTVYIGQTRVTLETLIAAFHRGETPEQIIQSFDVLSLVEVYAVITYYLRHQDEVDAYIRQHEVEAEHIRQTIIAKNPDLVGLRERLLARLKHKQGET
jgi:uncharacterized protein (DUF433 family)